MKRWIVFLFLAIGLTETGFAQESKARCKVILNGETHPRNGTYGDGCSNNIYTNLLFKNGGPLTVLPWHDLNGGAVYYSNITTYFDAHLIPDFLVTTTSRNWKRGIGGCGGNGSFDNSIRETRVNFNYGKNHLCGISEWWNTCIDLYIIPEIQILPPSKNPALGRILGSNDPFELKATPGFPAHTYKWEYNVGGDSWLPIPNSYGRASLSFTGYELLGVDRFEQLCGKQNVFFRIAPCQECIPPIVTATLKLSSPHIIRVEPIPNTCFGERNGSLRIYFDRNLRSDEMLRLSLADDYTSESWDDITSFREGNMLIWDSELAPRTYELSMIGKYRGMATYTDNDRHYAFPVILGPEPVVFKTSQKHVSCFAGDDASITVEAVGGVGQYVVGYKRKDDPEYRYEAFGSSKKHVITNLSMGTYQVRLYDAKGCVMKDKKGQEVIGLVDIKQPAAALAIDYQEGVDPRAFGYTDGSITVITVGGTPLPNEGYHVVWKDSLGNVLPSVSNKLNPFTTQLHSVGKGTYTLMVTDANYSSSSSKSAAGCLVQEVIKLGEPLPLEVIIKEGYFISCSGATAGELIAQASGGVQIPGKRYQYEWFKQKQDEWIRMKSDDGYLLKGLSGGVYQVQVTDNNGITKTSEAFHLIEPKALKVVLSSRSAKCSGSNTGAVSSVIVGGTLPYHIQWNTGDTDSSTLENVPTGYYHISVTDARGCQAEAEIEVSTPNPIELRDLVIKSPTCFGGADGSIRFHMVGGVPPYTYMWYSTVEKQDWTDITVSDRNNLSAGSYMLLVTDAMGCSYRKACEVIDPPPLAVELGPDRTLCTGQTWIADARIADRRAKYRWSGSNGFYSDKPSVILKESGTYSVVVANGKGCQKEDSIVIHRSDLAIEAEYTSPTHAFVDDPVLFVNVTDPEPEGEEWTLPEGSSIKVLNRNKKVVELAFTQAGSYEVVLRTTIGDCQKIFKRPIVILQKDEVSPSNITTASIIKAFKVGPNPNGGEFTAEVHLEKVAPIGLSLVQVQTGATVDLKRQSGGVRYTIPYHLQLVSGPYVLVLEVGNEYRIFRVIIL